MTTLLTVTLLILLPAQAPKEATRKPHPFAPSLPQMTDEEEAQFDKIIDDFILYDIGKLRGPEGKRALEAFNRLGPEATFALIRGLNRAAAFESSCPAVVIGKKLNAILRATRDNDLLDFARENMGTGVVATRHINVIKDLRVVCIIRKRQVYDLKAMASRPPAKPRKSLAQLAKEAELSRGSQLRPILIDIEKYNGDQVLNILAQGAISYETDTKKLAADLLVSFLSRQSDAYLKKQLADERSAVRSAAARAVGQKGARLGKEVIALLGDADNDVRQSARAGLVKLSRGVDHGPEPNASAAERGTAIARWKSWWALQQQR